jgi:HSP20 family protein
MTTFPSNQETPMILTAYRAPRQYTAPAFRSFRSFDRASSPSATPAVTGRWNGESYQLTVDLPGVPAESVAVSVAGRTLTIDVTGESSSWSRQIRLPQTLDADQVTARYADGRLTVLVAKTAEAEPRRIAVDTAPAVAAGAQSELVSGDDAVAADSGDATSVTE